MKEQIVKFWEKHERRVTSASLVLGFVIDNLTLTRVDLLFDNLVLLTYLSLAGLGIFTVNLFEAGKIKNKTGEFFGKWMPLVIQFSFGALFSGFFVFYSKSASLSQSFLFLILLLGLLIGNEFARKRYQKLTFQLSVYFFALYSYSIFILPVLTDKIGPNIFILSGALSLVLIGAVINILKIFIRQRVQQSRRTLMVSIGSIFLVMNVMYFANIIPPIPLSLREANIYHDLDRQSDGDFLAVYESKKWYEHLLPYEVYHIRERGETAYFFSSIFAPANISTRVSHIWQYYDETKRQWIDVGRIDFPIRGGRDQGYRGYSQKSNIFPGTWRVDIRTSRGGLIGRLKFKVELSDVSPELKMTVL